MPANLYTYMYLLMSMLVVKYLKNPQRFLLFYSFNKYILTLVTCHETEGDQTTYCPQRSIKIFKQVNLIDC